MWLCSVHGFFTGATSAYLKDSLLPPHTLEVVFKRPTLSKILSLCSKLLPKKEIQCTNVEICTSNYIPRIWCVSAGIIFLKSKRPSNQHCLRRRAGRALLKSKDPERAVFFHWVPTRGQPAAGSAPRKRPAQQNPPFSKGKDEISLVVEEWISGYQKRWVNWFLGKQILGSKRS